MLAMPKMTATFRFFAEPRVPPGRMLIRASAGQFCDIFPITMLLAICSWHFIERAALKWKGDLTVARRPMPVRAQQRL
jgi:peptidoglycan/LPS O-acetylase OafA/YrhL